MKKQTDTENVFKKATLIKIAIDMHLRNYRVVRQIDHSHPQPAARFSPEEFYLWLEKQRGLGERVVVSYEAGCFGYEPARRMGGLGVEVCVIAPQDWDEQGKHQVNDKHDALVMCRRLSEYLDGHHKALSVVRIPSREEEARRAAGRMREQLRRELRRMQAMGRSLLLQRELVVSGRWWAGSTWLKILKVMAPWVIAILESWKKVIELIEEQAQEIEAQIRAAAPVPELLFGEGELTHELLSREMIDAHRFKNARQVGNYFGLCPSESTSDQCRRLGSITKHGNPRLRRLIVELAWRLSRFQPGYRAVRQWGRLLEDPKVPAAVRKKAIVALARRLAVDLWRIATGRVQAEELGLVRKLNASSLLERPLPCP
jgi:transposase